MKNIPEGYLGFICLPELITGNGTYKTRCGELVIIDQCPEMPLMDGLDVGGYYTRSSGKTVTMILDPKGPRIERNDHATIEEGETPEGRLPAGEAQAEEAASDV